MLWRLNRSGNSCADSAVTDVTADPPGVVAAGGGACWRGYDKEGNVDRAIANLERGVAGGPAATRPAHAYLSDAYRAKAPGQPGSAVVESGARGGAARGGPRARSRSRASGSARVCPSKRALETKRAKASRVRPISIRSTRCHTLAWAWCSTQNVRTARRSRRSERGDRARWRRFSPVPPAGAVLLTAARAYADAATDWELGSQRRRRTTSTCLRNLGAVYYFLGRHDDAASSLQRALEVRPAAGTYTNLGTIRFFQGSLRRRGRRIREGGRAQREQLLVLGQSRRRMSGGRQAVAARRPARRTVEVSVPSAALRGEPACGPCGQSRGSPPPPTTRRSGPPPRAGRLPVRGRRLAPRPAAYWPDS